MLATVSWDKTLRVRDCIEKESNTQVVQLEAEGISIYLTVNLIMYCFIAC